MTGIFSANNYVTQSDKKNTSQSIIEIHHVSAIVHCYEHILVANNCVVVIN